MTYGAPCTVTEPRRNSSLWVSSNSNPSDHLHSVEIWYATQPLMAVSWLCTQVFYWICWFTWHQGNKDRVPFWSKWHLELLTEIFVLWLFNWMYSSAHTNPPYLWPSNVNLGKDSLCYFQEMYSLVSLLRERGCIVDKSIKYKPEYPWNNYLQVFYEV